MEKLYKFLKMVLAPLSEHEYFMTGETCEFFFLIIIIYFLQFLVIIATPEEIKYGVEITDLKRSQKQQGLIQ